MFRHGSQVAVMPLPMPADPYSTSFAWSKSMPNYPGQPYGTAPPVFPGPPVNEYSEMAHVAPYVSFGQTPVLILHV